MNYSEETKQNINQNFSHPKASELNDLEAKKRIAKANNDMAAYKAAQAEIERIIRENPAQVSPEQWDSMSTTAKKSFITLKMNEAKVMHDQDSFNYWRNNLNNISEKSDIHNKTAVKTDEKKSTSDYNDKAYLNIPENRETQKKDYKFYMDEMIRLVKSYNPDKNYSEEEKKQLIGEVFYNQGYLVQNLSSDEDFRVALTTVVNSLGGNTFSSSILNSTINDMQIRYEQLHPKKDNKSHNKEKEDTIDLTKDIESLRKRLFWVQNEFHDMIADKHLDSDEIARLINMMKSIIDDGDLLRVKATSKKDKDIIAFMVDEMEQELNKMRKLQQKTEDVQRQFL